ncbi:MAG: hypothetical protein WD066_19025 [Planctomycetaceae bacterium]
MLVELVDRDPNRLSGSPRSWYDRFMDTVIRDVAEIAPEDRPVVEHVLGRALRGDEQLVNRITRPGAEPKTALASVGEVLGGEAALPDWCDVYAGLTDEEIADWERIILTRADLSRPVE